MAAKVKVLERKPRTLLENLYYPELVRGLGVTVRQFVKNAFGGNENNEVVTLQYPEETRPYARRFRGRHYLTVREDGNPACVACMCCATVCPARAIEIEAGEVDDPNIEKGPVRFELDSLRCVSCGLCVEACPKDAIRMDSGEHYRPSQARNSFVVGLDELVRPDKKSRSPHASGIGSHGY